jgi:hypothetical protein
VPRTDTWDSACCGTNRKRQSHSCSDRIVRDECRVPQFGIGRYRAAPCVAGRRHMAPALKELVLVSVKDIGHFEPMSVHAVLFPP